MRLDIVVITKLLCWEPGSLLPPQQSEATQSRIGVIIYIAIRQKFQFIFLLQESHDRDPDDGHPDEDDNDGVHPGGPGLLHSAPGGSIPGLNTVSSYITSCQSSDLTS